MKQKEKKSLKKIIGTVVALCLIAPFLVLILSMVSSDKAAYKANQVFVDEDYDRKFTGVQVKMENSLSGETYTSGLSYRVNDTDMIACVSIGSATSETAIVIPTSYVEGSSTYTITAVDYSGFCNNTVLTSFTFNTPANITLIDAQAFAGDINLSKFNSSTAGSFVIPASLTEIYPDTFYGNAAMTALSFGGNSITSIGSNAFADCVGLASAPQFKIATSLTIGDSAFANCIALPNILLPSKVTSIGKCAFYNCYTAHFITIPSSCTSIGKDAFRLCTNAKAYIGSSSRYPTGWPSDGTDSGNDTIGSGSVTVSDWNYGSSSYAIPIKVNCDNVTTNGDYIYTSSWSTDYGKENSNTGIYLLTIIEYTGSSTTIDIPQVLPAQTDGTHYNTDMNDTSGNQYGIVYIIAEHAFNITWSISSITIPTTVYEIENEGFMGNSYFANLATLTFNDSNDTGGDTITIDSSHTVSLDAIGLPGLVTIGNYAFNPYGNALGGSGNNASVTSLTIPSTVVTIGDYAFYGYIYVDSLVFNQADTIQSLTTIGNAAFYSLGSSSGTIDFELVLPKTVYKIGSQAFYQSTLLRGVSAASPVTIDTTNYNGYIAYQAFSGCSNLRYAYFGNFYNYIGESCFSGDSNMESFYVYQVGSFGSSVFYGCSILTLYSYASGSTYTSQTNGVSYYFILNDDASYATHKFVYFGTETPNLTYQIENGSEKYSYIPAFTGLLGAYVPSYSGTKAANYLITNETKGYQYYSPDGTNCTLTKYLQYVGAKSIDVSGTTANTTTNTNGWTVTKIGDCFALSANESNLNSKTLIPLTTMKVSDSLTEIGSNAFFGCSSLTAFNDGTTGKFPTGLTTVGDYAFFHTNLNGIVLGSSVSSIGDLAFSYILSLVYYTSSSSSDYTSVLLTVDSGNTNFKSDCNALYQITSTNVYKLLSFTGSYYSVSSSTDYWGDTTYSTALGTLTVLSGTTEIGEDAFFSGKLGGIILPNSLTTIDDYGIAYYSCNMSTTSDTYINDFLSSTEKCDLNGADGKYNYSYITSITIADTDTTTDTTSSLLSYIGKCAFYCQSSATVIDLPNNSATIGLYLGAYSFRSCCSLVTLVFPTNITYLDDEPYVVYSTSNTYYSGTVYSGGYKNTYCSLSDYMFDRAASIGSNNGEDDPFTFPSCITRIGKVCFWGCKKLKYIKMEAIKVIDNQAFDNCTNLVSVALGDSKVERINYMAFNECTSLTTINLNNQNSLEWIGQYAFQKCTSLPSTLNLSGCSETGVQLIIDSQAFGVRGTSNDDYYRGTGCYQITAINLSGCTNLYQINANAFDGTRITSFDFSTCTGLTTINASAFKGLESYLATVKFYSSTTVNGVTTTTSCTSLKTIGNSAFAGLTKLKTVNFTNCTSLNSLGESCFSGDTALTTSTFTLTGCTALKSLGAYCFSGCTNKSFTTLTISPCTGITSIGDYCFSGCTKFTSLDLSALTSLTNGLGTYVFNGCTALTTVTFPTSLTKIGDYCFNGDILFTKVAYKDDTTSLTTIGSNAFNGCVKITSFTIPGTVTSIGSSAFTGCTGLKTLIFSDGTADLTIGDSAFNGCTALVGTFASSNLTFGGSSVTAFILPDRTDVLGANVFTNCSSMLYIYLPSTIDKVGTALFTGCSSSIKIFVNVAYSEFVSTDNPVYQSDSHWIASWSSGFLTNRYFYSADAPKSEDWEAVGHNALAGFFKGTISTGISLYTQ